MREGSPATCGLRRLAHLTNFRDAFRCTAARSLALKDDALLRDRTRTTQTYKVAIRSRCLPSHTSATIAILTRYTVPPTQPINKQCHLKASRTDPYLSSMPKADNQTNTDSSIASSSGDRKKVTFTESAGSRSAHSTKETAQTSSHTATQTGRTAGSAYFQRIHVSRGKKLPSKSTNSNSAAGSSK